MNSKNKQNSLKSTLIILLLFLCWETAFCSISICSWNLQDFGKSKSEVEIDFIASTIQGYDVIAIQEVVTNMSGAQAVAKLVNQLNRKGKSWDYTISDPTVSSSVNTSERYAFIWNKKTVLKLGDAWLDKHYVAEIEREPYFGTFKKDGETFTVVNFHAKPKSKQPETDIKYFKSFPALYPSLNLIFCGDFNCPQSNSVFNPLKALGFKPAFVGQKTSLRMKCLNGDCLASEYDNLFFDPKKTKFVKAGVVHFYKSFSTIAEARKISDHLPVFLVFE